MAASTARRAATFTSNITPIHPPSRQHPSALSPPPYRGYSTMPLLRITPLPAGKTCSANGFRFGTSSARARLSFTSSVTVTGRPISVINHLYGCSALPMPRITLPAGITNSAFGSIRLLASSDGLHLMICGFSCFGWLITYND